MPIVVIAGRTNVGKSALFNRLAGRRLAIVHEEEGVTRDRVVAQAVWEGRHYELVDTGGVLTQDGKMQSDALHASVRRQTDAALAEASAIIFVTDVESGPVPLDKEVARLLRRAGKPVFVACNKCDTEARDEAAGVCEQFGYPVFPVSALHNRGIADLMEAVCKTLPAASSGTQAHPLRIVFAGRPNVGKSSLTNALLKRERVIVSAFAGTTRDSIDIPFKVGAKGEERHYVLTDTAGIRQAGKVGTAVEKFSLIRAEESIRQAHVAVLLMDAEQGPTRQDKAIAALIREHRRGCVIVINKWDLARGKVQEKAYAAAFRREVSFLDYAPLIFVSSKTGYNTKAVMDTIDQVATQIRATLSTGVLNRTLNDAYERVAPPTVKGKRLKIYYATQIGIDPVRIALFVNDPTRWVPAYETYLVKALRSRFGLEGAPVVLIGRAKRGGERGAEGATGRPDRT
ncbi:MAG: ribosome biogenesis GTPase Der [Kiritimatiellia bacterium]